MIYRIFADIVLLMLVFLVPWWVVALIAIMLLFIFPFYYEAVLAGFVIDMLFGTGFFITALMLVCTIGVEFLKTRMRAYN